MVRHCLISSATFSRQSTFAGIINRGQPNGGGAGNGPGYARSMYLPAPPAPPSPVAFTVATGLGMGTVLRFNTTAGDVAQTLPKIRSLATAIGVGPTSTAGVTDGVLDSTSMVVTIKNELGAGDVVVSPNPVTPDTIEGGPGPVVVPPGGSRTFMSDGISNWIIVGGYL